MAKQALLRVLDSTIGRYVQNLDAESLNVAIWNGSVELHDLKLDTKAINAELLANPTAASATATTDVLPIEVVDGTFQSFKLEIPWRNLSSKSVVIKATGLHVRVQTRTANASSSSSSSPPPLEQQSDHHDGADEQQSQSLLLTAKHREEALILADTTREQTNELYKLATHNGGDKSNSSSSSSSVTEATEPTTGFLAKLVKRIIENIQVDIQDVSVVLMDSTSTNNAVAESTSKKDDEGDHRYATTTTTTSSLPSMGVILKNLSFVTTDMTGQRTFVDRTNKPKKQAPNDILNKFLYKKLSLNGFAIFVDNGTITTTATATATATTTDVLGTTAEEQHQYILEPLDLEAKFREADSSITNDYPKWMLQSKLPALKMALSHDQYQQTMLLSRTMTTTSTAGTNKKITQPNTILFPEYRPLARPWSGSVQEWWQYAYLAVCRLTGRRSWSNFFQAFKKRKTYIALYKRKVYADDDKGDDDNKKKKKHQKDLCPWLEPLSIEEFATLDRIESDRTISIEGIMMWRNLADAQVELERQKYKAEHPTPKRGFLGSLFGGGDNDGPATLPIELSTEELKELEGISLSELGYSKELSGTSKLARIEFQLGEFSVQLKNTPSDPMLGLKMGIVSTKLEMNNDSSFDFDYRMTSLDILDHGAERSSSYFPKILRGMKQAPHSTVEQTVLEDIDVFQVNVSKTGKGDSKLMAKLLPFEAVLAPHLVTQFCEFIKISTPSSKPPSMLDIKEFQDEGTSTGGNNDDEELSTGSEGVKDNEEKKTSEEYAEDVANALVEAWEQRKKQRTALTIDLELHAPILLFPENITDPHATVMVLDFGGMIFRYGPMIKGSSQVTQWIEDHPIDDDSNHESLVDYGRMELEHMTFIVGKVQNWRQSESERDETLVKQDAIVEPITVQFDFAVESSISSRLPRACVFANIPASNFKFSPMDLSLLLRVYNEWIQTLRDTELLGAQPTNESSSNQAKSDIASNRSKTSSASRVLELDEVDEALSKSLPADRELHTTLFVKIALEKYSMVIYDSGDIERSVSAGPTANVAEALIMEGGTNLNAKMATDVTGEMSSMSIALTGNEFEIFSAFGKDLQRPLQILEPLNGTVKLSLLSHPGAQRIEIKANANDSIEVIFSMRNLALINAISDEVSECLIKGLKRSNRTPSGGLEPNEGIQEQQLEAIEQVLKGEDDVELVEVSSKRKEITSSQSKISSVVIVDLKIPHTNITIINDLQGLDEALFRIRTEELTTKSMVAQVPQLIFNVQLYSKFLADYFDPVINRWKNLLRDPWEIAMKSERAPEAKSNKKRYGTRADVKIMPLRLKFSEHFLIGLGSANRMLAMSTENKFKKSRHLVAALPYALENCSGMDVEYTVSKGEKDHRTSLNGSKEYFRISPVKGNGKGGKRQYGEDATHDASMRICIGNNTIDLKDIDDELGQPKRCHILDDTTMLVTNVVKEGKVTVVRLASNVLVQNRTPVPIYVSVIDEKEHPVGICTENSVILSSSQPRLVPYNVEEGTLSKQSKRLGIRFDGMAKLVKKLTEKKRVELVFRFAPKLKNRSDIYGELLVEADLETIHSFRNKTMRITKTVTCSSSSKEEDFVFQATIKVQLIEDRKVIANITLQPIAQLINTLPVGISVLTQMRHIFSSSTLDTNGQEDRIHHLPHGAKMEVYCTGSKLPLKVRFTSKPADGTLTSMTRKWIDVPLDSGMATPLLSVFPFDTTDGATKSAVPGSEFYIAEANTRLSNFFLERVNDTGVAQDNLKAGHRPGPRTLLFTVGNYGVDHTNSILFEQVAARPKGSVKGESHPFSAFLDKESGRKLSLLPTSEVPIRLNRPGSSGSRCTAIFRVEEVSMSQGGAQATPLLWDDGSDSGYFAYRRLVSTFQSELHVIPEFLVYNGDDAHAVSIRQSGAEDIVIPPLKIAPVFSVKRTKGLQLALRYEGIDGSTTPVNLEDLGLHVEVVRSSRGESLGSVAMQTSIGSADSRLVIKLGKVGSIEREKPKTPLDVMPATLVHDNLRFRIQVEEISVTLNQAETIDSDAAGTLEVAKTVGEEASKAFQRSERTRDEIPICTVTAKTLVYDAQKLFKESEEGAEASRSAARCQLSILLDDFQIRDEMPGSPYPIVFRYSGDNRLLDFCVRTKGPLYAKTVHVDLFDVLVAHSGASIRKEKEEKLIFQTNEAFVWKLIDTAELISQASAEGAQQSDPGDVDKVLEAFVPKMMLEPTVEYATPRVSTIFKVEKANVSPFNLVVSFERTPQSERYEKFINNQGAYLMRYFTQQLKFTIKNCNLRFAHYEEHSLTGPADRLIEILMTVYISRIKLKAVTILAASSFSDWKNLSGRDSGDDEFVDGDVLRVSGTIAGNSAAYAFKRVGRGLGKGISSGFDKIGGGLENGAALIGAESLGSGIHSVVAGVGGGVGGAFQGVGEGAGSVLKGAGKGLGQFFGGISGGGSKIVKGIGKGIVSCDGSEIVSGFKQGGKHMASGVRQSGQAVGSGVGRGVGSAVMGSVKGVRASTGKTTKQQMDGLAKLREEFKEQDYN